MKNFFRLSTLCLLGVTVAAVAQEPSAPAVPATGDAVAAETETEGTAGPGLKFTAKSIDGADVDLSKYAGKVVVIVNTASKCGMTTQYKQLQELHEKWSPKGVTVLGFPCNQFGGQEPGSEAEIKTFCTTNYGVTFDMFSKIDVNGEDADGLYKFLTVQELQPKGAGDVGWNFEKFVLDKSGKPIARFGSRVAPDDKAFMEVITTALAK
jgi:glutathione peroxidase